MLPPLVPGVVSIAQALEPWLTTDVCRLLDEDGFAVLDNAPLPAALAHRFLLEVMHCFSALDGSRTPNQIEFLTSGGKVRLTKPGIFECDLHQRSFRQHLPLFESLFESQLSELVELLRARLGSCRDLVPFSSVSEAEQSVTLKLQMNTGGSFPWHYDNPGRPNRRRLTLAVYLSDGWDASAHGGELVLQPFLGVARVVPPVFNTIVLFRSDMVAHAVRPVRHTGPGASGPQPVRYCFTIWFDGAEVNSDADLFLRSKHLTLESVPMLQRSPLQRTLSRVVYDEEYQRALVDCFGPGTREAAISLQLHEAHKQAVLQNEATREFIHSLRALKDGGNAAATATHPALLAQP